MKIINEKNEEIMVYGSRIRCIFLLFMVNEYHNGNPKIYDFFCNFLNNTIMVEKLANYGNTYALSINIFIIFKYLSKMYMTI